MYRPGHCRLVYCRCIDRVCILLGTCGGYVFFCGPSSCVSVALMVLFLT
jgi:hypothetical protein